MSAMNQKKAGTQMHLQIERPSRPAGVLTTAVASLVILMPLGPLGTSVSHAVDPTAVVARTFSLNESGNLHLTSKHGFTLNERGPASGTVAGTIYVHLNIVSTTRVTAEISIYPSGGSITGNGTANYRREGATAHFSGSLSINRGTGSYRHAQGSGLSFSGVIQRSNDAVTVHVSGKVSD
jgi:hypothetical protein